MAAELGLSIDSSGMKPGLADLDSVVQKSQAAEQAATKMGQTVSGALKQAGQSTSDVASGLKATADNAGAAAEAVTHAGSAHGYISTQAMAASHSIRGFTEMMMQGVPPSRALAMEANNLSYAMSHPGGITGAFSEAIGVFTRFLTPTTAVAGSIAAVGLAAVGAAAHWQSAETDISRSLLGIGGASQATVKSIEGISAAIADTGKMSFGEAREAATAIASLGTVNVKLFAPLLDASHNLSIILGKDVTETAKMAGAAIGDLSSGSVDGILKLNQSLGFLSGTLLGNIQNLVASGRAMDAQKLAIDAIAQSSKGAGDTLSIWEQMGQNFKDNLSNAINNAGATITYFTGIGETLADQYGRASEKLKELQDLSAKSGSGSGLLQSAIEDQQKVVDDLQKKLKEAGLEQFTKEQDKLGLTARLTADGIATEYKQVRDLQTALANINSGPVGKSGDPEEQVAAARRLVTEIKNITNADGSVITLEQRQTAQFQAQISLVTARTAAEREAAAAGAARVAAIGSATDAELAANRAVALERAGINTAYQKSLELLQAQGELANAVTGSDKLDAQTQVTIVQLLQEGLTLEQATTIAAQQRANAEDGIDASIERQVRSLKQQTELIRARQNGNEAAVASSQAYQNAIDAGASSTEASALSAATLDNYMARAESSAGRFASSMGSAAQSISAAAQGMNGVEASLSKSSNNWSPSGGGAVGSVPNPFVTVGLAQFGGPSGFNFQGIDGNNNIYGSPTSQGLTYLVDQVLSGKGMYGGGYGDAANKILDYYKTGGFGRAAGLDSTAVGVLGTIYQHMADSGDTQSAIAGLQDAISQVSQGPHTLERDDLIRQLQDQLKQLTDATSQNTDATKNLSVGLDSIYSGGHSALAIGYYQEGETNYNYDPNGFFRGGKNYTAPSQPYDPSAGYQSPSGGGLPSVVNPNIQHYADGGVIEPYSLAYVGEHGPNPMMMRAGAEPIMVTPNVPETPKGSAGNATQIIQNFTFIARSNDLGDRRTRRQAADGFGNNFRAQASA